MAIPPDLNWISRADELSLIPTTADPAELSRAAVIDATTTGEPFLYAGSLSPAYFGVQPHSGHKRHPTGGYWCFPLRGAGSVLGRWRLKVVRFGKQTLHKLRSG